MSLPHPDDITGVFSAQVVRIAAMKGFVTIEDLQLAFPERKRRAIATALNNAKTRGVLELRVSCKGGGCKPSEWVIKDLTRLRSKKRTGGSPIPSVFHLAQPLEWKGVWPPLHKGRTVETLGSWD